MREVAPSRCRYPKAPVATAAAQPLGSTVEAALRSMFDGDFPPPLHSWGTANRRRAMNRGRTRGLASRASEASGEGIINGGPAGKR